ncbi:MAG: glycosyltransferase family 4 protein [Candidatus Omnitrophica bacterium]|nr:glycosyltransferase family 4 protein [Candidatus Omnitrophota bacterium]
MKILILTNHLNIGGITRYVLELSKGLKQRGHDIFVGSLSGWAEGILKENGISFLKLPLKTKSILSPRLIAAYFILKEFIQREDIALIHAQTRITQFLAFLVSRKLGIAYVSTFHGFYQPHLVRRKIPCLGDSTIAISEAVGKHLVEDFGLEKKKLNVIYNSISLEENYSKGGKDYSSIQGSPILAIIARLSAEKGHILLFQAVSRLIKEYPSIRLLVIGTGRKEQQLKAWVRKEGLGNHIIFLGAEANLRSLFKIIDISVLPSSKEGLGFSILEAQSRGIPVVASRVGGISEIIKDKETGILFQPGDVDGLCSGIKQLLVDPSLGKRIIDNAKKQIKERFSLEEMLSRVEAVYKKALESKGQDKR